MAATLTSKSSRRLYTLLEAVEEKRRYAIELQGDALRSLPSAFGYRSAKAFLWAFKEANGLTPKRAKTSPNKLEALIRLTKAGRSRDEIAAALGIAPQTVSNLRYKLSLARPHRRAKT